MRSRSSILIPLLLLSAATLAGACGGSTDDRRQSGEEIHPATADTSGTTSRNDAVTDAADASRRGDSAADAAEAGGGSETITEHELRRLLARESALYWGIYELATGEQTTIGDLAMVALDPAKVPTMEALRTRYRETYSERAIDTVLRDFGVREQDGRLWIVEAGGGDLSDYEGTKLIEARPDGERHLIVRFSVPLGDSGDREERLGRLERTEAGWRVESIRPLAGSDQ